MLSTALDSAKLFFSGKLFQDYKTVFKQLAIAAGCGVLVMVVIGQFAPMVIAGIVGGAVAGFLQPILFKDLKYA